MNEETENWNQDPGKPDGQQPQYQQQPPQQPQYQQQPQNQQHGYQSPPPAKSKMPMIIGGIAVVAVVVILLVWLIMAGSGSGLVGTWEYSESYMDMEISMTMTFRNDGTGTFTTEALGQRSSDDFEWEASGGELTITSDGESNTVDYELRDGGNTLLLLMPELEELGELELKRV